MAKLIPILPWIALALAAILLLYALLGDALRLRFRRRRRCPKCWYDLSATPGRRCSECGNEAKDERQLWRFRRRWGRIGFGTIIMMLVAGGWAGHLTHRIRTGGWWEAPDWLLLLIAETQGYTDVGRETPLAVLHRRYTTGGLSDALEEHITSRAADLLIPVRTRLPVGAPLSCAYVSNEWFDWAGVVRVTDLASGTVLFEDVFNLDEYHGLGSPVRGYTRCDFHGFSDTLPEGTAELQFLVEAWTLRRPTHLPPQVSRTITRTIRVGGDLHDVLTPMTDDAVAAALRDAAWWDQNDLELFLDVGREPWRPGHCAVGVRADICFNGEPVYTGSAWDGPERLSLGSNTIRLAPLGSNPPIPDPEDPAWTIRLTGDGYAALNDARATHYWAGVLEFPLSDGVKEPDINDFFNSRRRR